MRDHLCRPRKGNWTAGGGTVGHANAANPFCVIVPCHRLIGANGNLTGYSGGVERKRWLLDHEARQPSRPTGFQLPHLTRGLG